MTRVIDKSGRVYDIPDAVLRQYGQRHDSGTREMHVHVHVHLHGLGHGEFGSAPLGCAWEAPLGCAWSAPLGCALEAPLGCATTEQTKR